MLSAKHGGVVATLKIEEIRTKSFGGWDVVLTGIDPTDHDFMHGTIDTPGRGVISGRWDDAGYLRGGTAQCNIDPNDPDIAELIALGKQLGAP
jgi:hypothetical protein